VTALIPGPTETNFAATAGTQDSRLFRTASVMSAAAVARVGFDGLMAGKRVAIAGASNRLTVFSTRLAPRAMLAKITSRLNS
jgi:short-subunit dehydrogenase